MDSSIVKLCCVDMYWHTYWSQYSFLCALFRSFHVSAVCGIDNRREDEPIRNIIRVDVENRSSMS